MPTLPTTADGLSQPTLAFGLDGIKDWAVGMQFLDIMKTARPWMGQKAGEAWAFRSNRDLHELDIFDENGWPTEIPDSVDSINTVWSWSDDQASASRAGTYVLNYEGSGALRIKGVDVISQSDGRIVFTTSGTRSVVLDIEETDPEGTGDYIRDISVVREDMVDLHETGAIFNPAWLALIEDASLLRFMNWQETNANLDVDWDTRTTPDTASWSQNGAPVEVMVALANQLGADPWFNIPTKADDAYVRAFAEYVHEHLDPRLNAHVELGNELWNFSFQAPRWLQQQAQDAWGEPSHVDYHAKLATNMALIWKDVYGADAEERLTTVVGTQAVNSWISNRLLTAPKWAEHEPDQWVDPASVFDAVATTTYFGGSIVKDAGERAALIAAIQDPNVDAKTYLYDKLVDPATKHSVPSLIESLAKQAQVAETHGVRLLAYEGGQHVHHSFSVSNLSDDDIAQLQDFMTEFVRSEEMAALYQDVWDIWAEVGDGPFMQFVESGTSAKWGTWGTYQSLDDTNPRAELLEELNATSDPWWETLGRDVTGYLHGRTIIGLDVAETLTGTVEEDFLIGRGGDDVLIGGRGDDGLHGGAGIDTVVFSGAPVDYVAAQEEGGLRISGPDGSDFLSEVEFLQFSGGRELSVSDFLAGRFPEATDGVVTGTNGSDVMDAAAPVDPDGDTINDLGQTIYGLAGNDLITAGAGSDSIDGGSQYDTIYAGDGDDQVWGGYGRDVVQLGSGDDAFFDNAQTGRHGLDRVDGGSGNDTINGGGGDDTFIGGSGNDILTGGIGADEFVFSDGDGSDLIADFESAEDTLTINGVTFDPNDLRPHERIEQIGTDVEIGYGTSDTITLQDVDLAAWQGAPEVFGQAGSLVVTQSNSQKWFTVTFDQAIPDAVVVLGPVEHNGSDPTTTRVRNVTETGFEFQIDEWNYRDGAHMAETVGWMAVRAGEHTLSNGSTIIAGTQTVGTAFESVTFGTELDTAIVLSEVTSVNGSDAVTTRHKNVTSDGFDVRLQEEEALGPHVDETVSWIAVEAGASNGFEAVRTPKSFNHVPDSFDFVTNFDTAPVLLAGLQSFYGADTATVRFDDLTQNGVELHLDEETSRDAEIGHTLEILGYVAIDHGWIV